MTGIDTTELAQSLKAAAVRAKTATEEYASGHMSVSVCYAECEEFNRLTDGPDNIITLVEALEKAQQRNGELEQKHCGGALMEREIEHVEVTGKLISEIDIRDKRIDELEESHAQVIQSRDHYKRMSEEGLKQLAESRTVTVRLPDISSKAFWSSNGKTEVFHPETYKRWVKEAIERYCAIARIEVEVK